MPVLADWVSVLKRSSTLNRSETGTTASDVQPTRWLLFSALVRRITDAPSSVSNVKFGAPM